MQQGSRLILPTSHTGVTNLLFVTVVLVSALVWGYKFKVDRD